MQKLTESIPLILLTVLSSYFFFSDPSLAQSLIVAAISGLVGYRYYLDSLVKPDFEAMFTERLDGKDKEINDIIRNLEVSISEVKEQQGKISIVKTQEKASQFKW